MSEITPIAEGPIVVKLGGAALSDVPTLATLAASIARFHEANPGRLVLVHGGGPLADERLASAGIDCPKHDGLRATPPEAIGIVVECFRDMANRTLCGALADAGLDPDGRTLTDGGAVVLEQKTVPGVDLGCVGTALAGNGEVLRSALNAGRVPVLCCVGEDAEHGWLNVNADEAAGAVAQAVGATAVLLLSDVPGVLDERGERITHLVASETEKLIASGIIRGGMIPKVGAALRASESAGCPAIIAGWDGDDPIGAALSGGGTHLRATVAGALP